jgi:predicted RNA-binding protein with RPS1 domain
MSEEAATEDVPPEVEAMDGVADEEEAHNTDRPARGSGIHKHKKGGSKGTPLAELEIGAEVEATVKTTTSYGAFIDIGAETDALLHVSRLSDNYVANVEDVVKAGDTVTVRIVSVDTDKGQVAVTMRSQEAEAKADAAPAGNGGRRRERPRRSDGDRAAQAAAINALADSDFSDETFVEGEVVSTLDFGAFVRFDTAALGEGLEGELDGLVHISALQAQRTGSVSDVVSVGDKVQVRVKNVDARGGKISLSMISKEDEPAPREQRPKQQQNRGKQMFTESEMGAKDWKESMEKFLEEQPKFVNSFVIEDKRKQKA